MSTDSVPTTTPRALNRAGNRRGRTIQAIVAHIEAHVEELVALTEDTTLLNGSHRKIYLTAAAIMATVRKMREGTCPAIDGFRQIDGFLKDLVAVADGLEARSQRLRAVVIPEVRACYAVSEKRYEDAA